MPKEERKKKPAVQAKVGQKAVSTDSNVFLKNTELGKKMPGMMNNMIAELKKKQQKQEEEEKKEKGEDK